MTPYRHPNEDEFLIITRLAVVEGKDFGFLFLAATLFALEETHDFRSAETSEQQSHSIVPSLELQYELELDSISLCNFVAMVSQEL